MLGIFLDTETNGLNYKKHRILEVAFKIVDLQTGAILKAYQSLVQLSYAEFQHSDPESLKINGFEFSEFESAKSISLIQEEIVQIFHSFGIVRKKSVFICQNPSFDRVFFAQLIDPELQEKLLWPYHWLDLASMHFSKCMEKTKTSNQPYPWEIGFSKDAIASYYKLPEEEKPHRAMNGVDHLLICYRSVVGFPKATS